MKRILLTSMTLVFMLGQAKAQPQGGKIFQPSNKVTSQKVSFYNRLGIQIAGDLYLPENFSNTQKYPAIISSHLFGGVKEQSGSLYAQTMAERGFAALMNFFPFANIQMITPRPVLFIAGDRADLIPFDKSEAFFKENMNK